jgi:hypothetical protein
VRITQVFLVAACSGNYETGGRPVLFKDFQSDVSSTAQRTPEDNTTYGLRSHKMLAALISQTATRVTIIFSRMRLMLRC